MTEVRGVSMTLTVRFDEPCRECFKPVTREQFEADEVLIFPYGGYAHTACDPISVGLSQLIAEEFARILDTAEVVR